MSCISQLSFQPPNDLSSPQAQEYSSSLERYSYLWVDDRREFLRQFLLYGHVLTAEEIEAAGEEGVKEMPPSLEQFKEQVDGYEAIYSQVDGSKVRGMRNMWSGECGVVHMCTSYCTMYVPCVATYVQAYCQMHKHKASNPGYIISQCTTLHVRTYVHTCMLVTLMNVNQSNMFCSALAYAMTGMRQSVHMYVHS